MLRKTMIVLFAVASVAMVAPDVASARGGGGGGHGGGGWGGGGGGRSMGGGGWSSGGRSMSGVGSFRSAAVAGPGFNHGFNNHGFNHGFHNRFARRAFVFGAFAGPYAYYDDPYYDYAYDDSYYGDGGCYVVRQRVHTRYGWRIRPVQVCS
jgi:hypothetical protein